ncbi:MAG: large conductance mechanosensitive channel protein MscL [Bacteroidetes bacterium]|jgi:large conductance mechanosensitive channel|nr:large conductance mechanosensitive channel protein MscL [Bacteroidota bacterium]MBT5529870.1 large conductance mechanosensitive channel protein MscL [Cytophagia bacterium]MBT3421967.1 large conductance mechanosensitive channel protein MscL [Bacteroidota bacterium]MBT3799620.1 large conductance mechanosensitive channel protein MscL [Bacteroidota bacterium]MBT3933128.1 large conductance mechanosensitive channel protein MscL [Bacteroidota bacterium]
MGMLKEFKAFAVKGNMVDMAVGIVIGAAFATVVKSLVNDIVMPIVSAIFNAPDFMNLFIVLKDPADLTGVNMESITAIREAGGVALGYGLFINAIIAFIIVAWVLFMIIKGMNATKKKEEEAPAAPPAPSKEEVLLGEIRDALTKK